MRLTFEQFKRDQNFLESQCKFYGEILHTFPRNAIGLVSDETRLSAEYKDAKAGYDNAFRSLRALNGSYIKFFQKELREERNRNRAAKIEELKNAS